MAIKFKLYQKYRKYFYSVYSCFTFYSFLFLLSVWKFLINVNTTKLFWLFCGGPHISPGKVYDSPCLSSYLYFSSFLPFSPLNSFCTVLYCNSATVLYLDVNGTNQWHSPVFQLVWQILCTLSCTRI